MLHDLIATADRINAFTEVLKTYPIHTESSSQVVRGRSAPHIDLNVGDNLQQAMTGRWTHISYRKRTTTYDHFENQIIYGVCLQLRKSLEDLGSKHSLKARSLYTYLQQSKEFLDMYVFRPEFREVNVRSMNIREIEFYRTRRYNAESRQAFFMAIDLYFELPSITSVIAHMT